MTIEKQHSSSVNFLDMQGTIGVTKHIGGFDATNELLSLCHIENAWEVLNVGCGIGVGSIYIAKKYGCQVVGVDISDKMVEWSRRRAREERVEAKVEDHINHWKAEVARSVRGQRRPAEQRGLGESEVNHLIYMSWRDCSPQEVLTKHRQVQEDVLAGLKEAPEEWFGDRVVVIQGLFLDR